MIQLEPLARLLNHTFTPMAHRLLRINILAPITGKSRNTPIPTAQHIDPRKPLDPKAIEHRLEVVQGMNPT
jgi:hypothetical protein